MITGATGGLGRFVCRHLALTGHGLIVLVRSEQRLAALRAFVAETAPELASVSGAWIEKREVVPCPFRDEALEERLWATIAASAGSIP